MAILSAMALFIMESRFQKRRKSVFPAFSEEGEPAIGFEAMMLRQIEGCVSCFDDEFLKGVKTGRSRSYQTRVPKGIKNKDIINHNLRFDGGCVENKVSFIYFSFANAPV